MRSKMKFRRDSVRYIDWLMILAIGMMIAVLARLAKAGDWPMLAHDQYHSGSTYETLPFPLVLDTSFVAGGPTQFGSQPVVEGCVAYLGGVGKCIKAYNFCGDQIEWEFSRGLDFKTACIYGNYVYVCAGLAQPVGNKIYKIDKLTGAALDSAGIPGEPNEPSINNGVVYIGYSHYWSGPWGITARDADNLSTELWNYPNPINHGMGQPAISTDETKLYSSDAGGCLRCLDATTGAQIWSFCSGHAWGVNNPSLVGDSIVYYVAGYSNIDVYALTADSGRLLWSQDLANSGYPSQTQAVANNILYVGADQTLYALDLLDSGRVLWTFREDGGCWSPSIAGEIVFVPTDENGGIYALDGDSGYVLWSYPCTSPEPQHGGPVIANGHLLFYMRTASPDSSILYDFSSPGAHSISIDIKPQSCPNPLNINSKGKLPVAILGSADFDVTTVDPATVMLEGVAPLRWNFEDVSTPVGPIADTCECSSEGPDGHMDMTLKFDRQEIVEALGPFEDGDVRMPTLSALTYDAGEIEGKDCVIILERESSMVSDLTAKEVNLGGNYPNPFNPETEINYEVARAGHVRLSVYNVLGRKVRTLVDEDQSAGPKTVKWDGKDENGADAASGIYFYKLETREFSATKKMILMK